MIRNACLALLLAAAVGCAGLSRQDAYLEASRGYARAMRWSDFDTATRWVRRTPLPAGEALKGIQVTAYQVRRQEVEEEGARVRQAADISYFDKSDMLVRTITVEEIWEYDRQAGQWHLVGGFPRFE